MVKEAGGDQSKINEIFMRLPDYVDEKVQPAEPFLNCMLYDLPYEKANNQYPKPCFENVKEISQKDLNKKLDDSQKISELTLRLKIYEQIRDSKVKRKESADKKKRERLNDQVKKISKWSVVK